MPNLDMAAADYIPERAVGIRDSVAVLHRRADNELIAGVFSGPWCELAGDAFRSALADRSASAAFLTAAEAVDARWRALSEEDRWDQGWGGTAEGVVVHATVARCRCEWLGANRAYHLRGRSVMACTAAHTVFQEMSRRGQSDVDPNFKRILVRWLSKEHASERVDWDLQLGDMALVGSRFVDERLIPAWIGQSSLREYVEGLAHAAGADVGRVSHTVVAITAREPT